MSINPAPTLTAATLPERGASEQLASSTNSKQAYTTEIVKALGGPAGDVVHNVPCSYQRQAGRLYVSTDGLFFYSNLFGFEKRIRLNYDQALEITKVRTTTLLVRTVEGEEFAFRSFDNRELVLETIRRYHPNAGPKHGANLPAVDSPSCDKSLDEISPRLRSIHGTSDAKPIPVEGAGHGGLGDEVQSNDSENFEEKENTGKSAPGTDSSNLAGELIEINAVTEWTKLRQLANGWESAIADLKIKYKSVQDFFDSFLTNDAINSLHFFLRNAFGDSNISIAKWREEVTTEGGSCLSRIIHYDHKAGITLVKVTRNQTYQRYGINSCLRTTTSVKGIRGVSSDAFFVEDMCFIEGTEKGIILNVMFHVKFTKSTMLRSVIQNRAVAEAKEWYTQYALFLRRKMNPREEIVQPASSSKAGEKTVEMLRSFFRQYVPKTFTFSHMSILLIVVLAIVIYHLKLRVLALEQRVLGLENDSERRLFELNAVKASILSFHHLFELEKSQVDTVMPTLDTNT
jgi:hypothetical protein